MRPPTLGSSDPPPPEAFLKRKLPFIHSVERRDISPAIVAGCGNPIPYKVLVMETFGTDYEGIRLKDVTTADLMVVGEVIMRPSIIRCLRINKGAIHPELSSSQ